MFKQPPRRAVVFDHIFLLKTYERLTNNYHRPRRRASLAYARYSTGLRVTRAPPRRVVSLESAWKFRALVSLLATVAYSLGGYFSG